MAESGLRVLVRAGALIALVLCLIWARCVWSGRAEWQAARAADARGDRALSMFHLRRCAGWRAPLSPYAERALDALEARDSAERAAGRPHLARLAAQAASSAEAAAREVFRDSLPGDPDPWFSALALAGWLLFSAAALRFVSRGLDAASWPTPSAPRTLLLLLAGFALFALGLGYA